MASTSIWRGFNNGVLAIKFLSQYPRHVTPIRLLGRHKEGLCDDGQIAALTSPGPNGPNSPQLAGIQFDDQTLIDVRSDFVALGKLLEGAFQFGRIDGYPRGHAALLRE